MTVPALIATPLAGKSLFSRHYLATHLPRHPEWAEDPGPVFARLAELWARGQRLGATWNENQTETEFLRPVLEALGWRFIPQAAATRSGRLNRPDYALFSDAATRDEAYPLQGHDDAFYGRSLAIAEAKHWGRPLSRQSAEGREQWDASTNPSHQMVNYLVGTRSPWGILTNGQIWRLYSREASSTASEFYEVDLATVFASPLAGGTEGGYAAFKLFWLFFRRDAFIPDSQGRNFVQRVAAGSASYARQVSDKLKELVYREVMPEVAAGFIAYRRERLGIGQETDATLAEIYRASLGLLYKLLFILYAEARGLLPADNPAYREESLTRMAAEYADKLDRGLPLSDATHATRQYDSLLALFHRIDLGDAALGIPRYDGGLFNAATPENRFLETHRLSDRAVARAVDILVRDAGEPVDYGYISVRNLGSIYEGLLENRLVLADRRPQTADGGPAAVGGQPSSVALVNDRGERKATGSYYTPDTIVDYIVRQTLGPVLDARQPVFEAAMARIAGLRGKLERTLDAGAVRVLREQLAAAESAAREAFLGIRCCDPAMGSGHFLVNAVDFLTDGIIQRMQAYQDSHDDVPWAWNPIQQTVGHVRRDIVEEMARQGIRLDPARLDDTSLLTRLVMKRCIYGVDLNRMAVELAKLSLWLHSFTVGAPLSFLDHHLRWGNSLIGADVRTVEAAIAASDTGQMALWGGPFAGLLDLTTTMLGIAGRADATLADVRRSADEFAAMQAALTPYKQALDLWVSQWFDEGRKTKDEGTARELLTVHGADVLPALRGERPLDERYRAAVERAHALWAEKRFFHWDLEFPEVFVDLARRDWAENPGFDAVIGNPPWGAKENLLSAEDYRYLSGLGVDNLNYYPYFVAVGLELILPAGQFAMVLPDSLLAKQYPNTRKLLLGKSRLQELVHLTRPFSEVDHDVILLRASKESATSASVVCRIVPFGSRDIGGATTRAVRQTAWYDEELDFRFNLLLDQALEALTAKLNSASVKFENICEAHEGIHTRHRRADIFPEHVDTLTRLHRPVLIGERSGDVVDRYHIDWGGRYVNYDQSLCTPNDKGMTPDLVDPNWFEQTKLVIVRTGEVFRTAIDYDRFYLSNNLFSAFHKPDAVIDVSYSFLCSLLNSTLLQRFLRMRLAPRFGNLYVETKITHLEQLPICRIIFTTPAADRARYAEEGRRLYAQFGAAGDPAPLLAFVDAHLTPSAPPPLAGEGAGGRGDVVHDLLAFLAEQMIAMNKAKQAEVKGFLAWLAREIGADIDALANKTRVQNYLGDYQKGEGHATLEDLLAVLRQNRRKLAVDPSARAFQERLAAEHAASLAVLLPLKARLTATDRLIDQVVYRLYGLTDDEIAIVAGR